MLDFIERAIKELEGINSALRDLVEVKNREVEVLNKILKDGKK